MSNRATTITKLSDGKDYEPIVPDPGSITVLPGPMIEMVATDGHRIRKWIVYRADVAELIADLTEALETEKARR